MTDVQTLTVEEVLKRARGDGRTVNEIMAETGGSETTTRRKVKALMAEGLVTRRPTLDGTKIIWAGQTEPEPEPLPATPSATADDGRQLSPRRIAASERDAAALEVLAQAGPDGLELPEVAKKIGAEDIEPHRNGWSQLTYLALRRWKRKGKVEKVIRWRVVPAE